MAQNYILLSSMQTTTREVKDATKLLMSLIVFLSFFYGDEIFIYTQYVLHYTLEKTENVITIN